MRAARALGDAAPGRELIDDSRILHGYADFVALVGDGDENGKAETAVMVYLDDGCTPDNAVSEMVANKLVELSDGATIKKVDEYQVELAAVEDEPTLLDTVLVIKRLRIKVGSKGSRS